MVFHKVFLGLKLSFFTKFHTVSPRLWPKSHASHEYCRYCYNISVANFVIKFDLLLNLVKRTSKNSKDSKSVLCFLELQRFLSYSQFCDFLLNKSCETYLGPVLAPGGRYRQLINPNFLFILDFFHWSEKHLTYLSDKLECFVTSFSSPYIGSI